MKPVHAKFGKHIFDIYIYVYVYVFWYTWYKLNLLIRAFCMLNIALKSDIYQDYEG